LPLKPAPPGTRTNLGKATLSNEEKLEAISYVLTYVEKQVQLALEDKLEKPLPALRELCDIACEKRGIALSGRAFEAWITKKQGMELLKAYNSQELRRRADKLVSDFPRAFKQSVRFFREKELKGKESELRKKRLKHWLED